MDPLKKAVGQTQDWSNPEKIIKEVHASRAARERSEQPLTKDDWLYQQIEEARATLRARKATADASKD